jgi:hypothetical protein
MKAINNELQSGLNDKQEVADQMIQEKNENSRKL